MNSNEICSRAKEWVEYKYWYGAKGQLATVALAKELQKESPNVWTESYYSKAIKDCDGKTRVGDCSGLVCYAYNIGELSSYGLRDKYPRWNGDPKDGMILWRKGHVGIYSNGTVLEMRGIDYDFRFDTYKPAQWTEIHYDPNVEYKAHDYDTGWHYDGPYSEGKGWWYAYDTVRGSYYHDCMKEINGAIYAFDHSGYMKEGTFMCKTDENGEVSPA